MTALARSLRTDSRGVTIVEFAMVAPVLLLVILGLSDLCYRSYAQSVLEGAVQKAGRDSSIQGGGDNPSTLDAKVISMAQIVAHNATFNSIRKNYDDFTDIGPEPFVDSEVAGKWTKDGICNHNEAFTDVNNNGKYDTDPGATGQGGASDVAYYTMTMTYPRLFPLGKMLGWSPNQVISASTILKNQPYATQTVATAGAGKCP